MIDSRDRAERIYDAAQHSLILEAVQRVGGHIDYGASGVTITVGSTVARGVDLREAFMWLIETTHHGAAV